MPMFYIYDKKQLIHKRVSILKMAGIILTAISVTSAFSYYTGRKDSVKGLTEYETVTLLKQSDEFSKEKLVQMLKDLNVKQPHIVMAQSILETGHWKSQIFLENHNLFGMKEARQRITTAGGTQSNHAFYKHWRESVYDYAFYQSSYLRSLRSEADYYQYLGASYAEASNYVEAVKELVQREELKKLFE
jgi:flagellum-specific peptidoglycan hydrolase FlgJ